MVGEAKFSARELLIGRVAGLYNNSNIPIILNNTDVKIKSFYKSNGETAGELIKFKDRIYVYYYGSSDASETLSIVSTAVDSLKCGDQTVHMYGAFKNKYDQSQQNLKDALSELDPGNSIPITFAGHSMGGALAQIAALEYKSKNLESEVKVITFGGPRVFCRNGAHVYNKLLGENTLLIQQIGDPVVHIPPPPMFNHAGYHRIRRYVKDPASGTHLPNAYDDICGNITDQDLTNTAQFAETLKSRTELILERKSLEQQIKKDRELRIKKSLDLLSDGKLKSAISAIFMSEARNKMREVQKNIDETLSRINVDINLKIKEEKSQKTR